MPTTYIHHSLFRLLASLSTAKLLSLGVLLGMSACGNAIGANAIVNGGFEDPDFGTSAGFRQVSQSTIPGWSTTSSNGLIEIWHDGTQGVFSGEGDQHAEINATEVGELFQTVSGIPGNATIGYSFLHRGRSGVDELELSIIDLGTDGILGGVTDTPLLTKSLSAPMGAWTTHSGVIQGLTFGNDIRFGFRSIPRLDQGDANGNLLDHVQFGIGIGVPEPSTVAIGSMSLLGLLWSRGRRQA